MKNQLYVDFNFILLHHILLTNFNLLEKHVDAFLKEIASQEK